jgi:hypothetical protein
MDKILLNRWTTAEDLFHDKKLKFMGASVSKIKRMLKEEGLNAYITTIVSEISNINKQQKRVKFCNEVRRWTQNLQKVIFSD